MEFQEIPVRGSSAVTPSFEKCSLPPLLASFPRAAEARVPPSDLAAAECFPKQNTRQSGRHGFKHHLIILQESYKWCSDIWNDLMPTTGGLATAPGAWCYHLVGEDSSQPAAE